MKRSSFTIFTHLVGYRYIDLWSQMGVKRVKCEAKITKSCLSADNQTMYLTKVMDFLIGGLAGAGATIFTNPIDVVKTRLQLQGELDRHSKKKMKYRGTFHALYLIARTSGPFALQKGLGPALVMNFFINAVSLGMFRIADEQGWTRTPEGNVSVRKAMFCSAASGLIGGMSCNPVIVVKTRLQSSANHSSIAVGRQYKYKGLIDGFKQIFKAEGLKGYFTGITATGLRLAVGYATQLTTFSKVKEKLSGYRMFQTSPLRLALAASAVSSVAVVLVGCPFDVAAVRLYNQGLTRKGKPLYNGIIDCLIKTYKNEGLYGLYKGIGPLYLKLGSNTTISLVIWDLLNNFIKGDKYTGIKK